MMTNGRQLTEQKGASRVGHAADARGRRVPVLDLLALRIGRRHDIIPAEAREAIAREVGFGLPRAQRMLFLVSVVCLCLTFLGFAGRCAALVQHGTFTVRGLVSAAGPLTAVWTGPVVFWAGARRMRLQRTVHAMLKHRRCPHCGYDIRGLPVDQVDGATVCPECGCAWSLPPSTNRPPDAPPEQRDDRLQDAR